MNAIFEVIATLAAFVGMLLMWGIIVVVFVLALFYLLTKDWSSK